MRCALALALVLLLCVTLCVALYGVRSTVAQITVMYSSALQYKSAVKCSLLAKINHSSAVRSTFFPSSRRQISLRVVYEGVG